MEYSHSLSLLFKPVFFLQMKELCPLTFYFLHFCFQKIWTLFLYILFHLGFWFRDFSFLHKLNVHALILLKFCTWNHSVLQYIVVFSFSAFLLLIDPKRDMWSPELTSLTSGLILPHVPEMKLLIFLLFCTYMYTNDWFGLCFHVHVLTRKRLCEANDTSSDVPESF